jgi:hypothetical protein
MRRSPFTVTTARLCQALAGLLRVERKSAGPFLPAAVS